MKNFVCVMAFGALMAFAPSANAALTINYSIDGGATMSCGTGPNTGPVTCSIVNAADGINISVVSASSNSPGTLGGAEQFGSTLEGTSTQTHTVNVWFSAPGFTQPTTNLTYESSYSNTSTSLNTTTAFGLESCIDTTDGNAPPLGCGGGSITNTNKSLTGAGSFADTKFSTVASVSTPYSLEQELTLSLTNGSDFNVITSQSLSPVPEPASLMLLGTGLLGAGLAFRKKAGAKRG